MNSYEQLLEEACNDGIEVIEKNFSSGRIKGLYCDGVACINKNMTEIEKACTLSEEYGHDQTSYGNILSQNSVENRKQELRARMWGYNKLIGLAGILKCYKHGCQNKHEMAEYLGVTEEFLNSALESYKKRYGEFVSIGDYTIYFVPALIVLKMN